MKWQDIISNVNIYGLEETVEGQTYPMVQLSREYTHPGEDSFLKGVVVQLDLTFTNKAWVEAERYHFMGFVNTQSPIQRITNVDLDTVYVDYVDARIIAIMKELSKEYNSLQNDIVSLKAEGKDTTTLEDLANQKYLELLYSNPASFQLTARMTTNYQELRTIYFSRRTNRLPEWRAFCQWIETLPHAEFITHGK